jgi:peptidoglycan hydrolase-like protein with peptidoglycan-binding domain
MTDIQKQCLLNFLGYDTGGIGNGWGEQSRNAVEQCQEDLNIEPDGIWEPQTEAAVLEAVYTWDYEVADETTGTFWDEIEYFDRSEFKCKCGGKYCNGYPAEPDERMVRIADQLRKNLGVPIIIVSGLRDRQWNAIQGGVSNSQHMYGEAADIYAKGVSQSRVEAELDKIGGVRYHYPITDSSNVHFDVPKGNR